MEVRVKKFLTLLALLSAIANLQAESRYVTDQFKVTLRSGESATHKITRMLPSGYQVELISSNPDNGYSLVKTQDGTTGYILTRQLMPIPSARDRLVAAEAKLAELQEAPGLLSAKLSKLQDDYKALSGQHQKLQQEKQALDDELQSIKRTAANAVRISNERNDLRKQVATLTREAEELKQTNRELGNDSAQRWFLIGGVVVVGGIILGLILPSLRVRKRKSSWGSL
ncbi:MAG: TIGR04211 family SH3 domain-containing protein [Sedimenticola selenatireducens]|uniref:TIGR04211 family SH3 domain-containing protein n=1 Tax=Sedimenticola selenatireducens TaxID=191960 RepID=A0A2N6CWA4_9GAMM|nr:MAG: TIGR04211 family SH3 domain-containing protein [Sedimenticola selenatireducens]